MKRPDNAVNDYWVLTDEDLTLAITAVQRDLIKPSAPSLFDIERGPGSSIGMLRALRLEQLRKLNTSEDSDGD